MCHLAKAVGRALLVDRDLKEQLGTLFRLDYGLVLYDHTSTYFEGLAAENELACRGYSRDHRGDCKQIVVALVVTRDGFPLAHRTFAGNTQDLKTVQTIVTDIETQFGKAQRIWVMDRGMISDESLKFLGESGRRYLLATRRGELAAFGDQLGKKGWKRLPNNPQYLAAWIVNPQQFKPGVNMPATPLSSDDLRALVAYLQTLK